MEIPLTLFSQRDDRWKNKKLGTSNVTIGGYGCLVTCFAMVAKYYGKDTDPDRLNQELIKVSGFANDKKEIMGALSNRYVWKSITKIYSDITEPKLTETPLAVSSSQFEAIAAETNSGRPVILKVDFIPATTEVDEHYVVVMGATKAEDGTWTLIVADPWYGDKASLVRYGVPSKTIQRFIFTAGLVPTQPVDAVNEDQQRALGVLTEAFKNLPAEDKYRKGNLEGYMRGVVEEHLLYAGYESKAKQFDALLEKWLTEWSVKTDPNKSNIVQLEEEMGKYLPLEDQRDAYRLSIEKLVGTEFDDDGALLKAHDAFKDQLQGYKGQLEKCLLKVGGEVVRTYKMGNYIVRIVKKPRTAPKP